MVSVLAAELTFFAPSTHSCVLAIVPVTFEVAVTSTGELTLDPLVGLQMWTPAEVGAEQDDDALTVIVDGLRYLRIIPAVSDDAHPMRTGGNGQRGIEESVIGKCTGKLFELLLTIHPDIDFADGLGGGRANRKVDRRGYGAACSWTALSDADGSIWRSAGWKVSRGCVQQGKEGGYGRLSARCCKTKSALVSRLPRRANRRCGIALQGGNRSTGCKPAIPRAG